MAKAAFSMPAYAARFLYRALPCKAAACHGSKVLRPPISLHKEKPLRRANGKTIAAARPKKKGFFIFAQPNSWKTNAPPNCAAYKKALHGRHKNRRLPRRAVGYSASRPFWRKRFASKMPETVLLSVIFPSRTIWAASCRGTQKISTNSSSSSFWRAGCSPVAR